MFKTSTPLTDRHNVVVRKHVLCNVQDSTGVFGNINYVPMCVFQGLLSVADVDFPSMSHIGRGAY